MKKLLFLIITMQITLFAETYIPINAGDVVEDHVNYLEKKYYQLELGKTQTADIQLTDLDADIDLYVAINRRAKIRDNDCYSSNGGTTYEKCVLTSTAPEGKENSIIILVYGFKASNYKLKISTHEGGESITEISETPLSGHLKQGESAQYKFSGKKGETYTTTLSALSADADLRVKVGKKAGMHSFDCKSTNGGTKTDECSLTLTKDATVYVHVNGYRTADYQISVIKEQVQDFPTARVYTENKKYFLAYEKVNDDRNINVFVVNNETKQATDHLNISTGLAEPMDILKITGADIFKSGIQNHTLYAINSNGKLIDVTSNYKIFSSYGEIHTDNYTTNKILNVQYNYQQNSEAILEVHSYDVSNPFNSDIVNKAVYKGKEILNFLAQYNCSNLHPNNKLEAHSLLPNSVICSDQDDEAYILYNKELTLINIDKPNNPIKTFENHHLLGGDRDTLHKINQGAFYTQSKEVTDRYKSTDTYSIYFNNKLSLTLQKITLYDDAYIESIEYNHPNKITIRLSNLGLKVYDISDINNPKLIKDDSPEDKITVLNQ